MGDIKAMDKLMEKFAGRKEELYKQKEEGKKVFGLFCSFVPIELVLASNSIPVGLCGGKDSTIPAAEEDLPRNICPLIKSSYGFKKTKSCPYFEAADIVIGETTCDAKKKMFELMEKFVPMHVMQLPHFKDEKSFKLWLSEVEELKDIIEKTTGNKITDEKLKETIDKVNKMRELFYKIYGLRANNPSPIKGSDTLKLFQFAYLLDVDDTIEILEDEDLVKNEKINNIINTLSKKGVKIAIDDFGSGYSNSIYLQDLQTDILKIDGSLIKKFI